MPSLHEVALLAAFLSPVLALVAINVFLALNGELHTLLMPRAMRFDSIVVAEAPLAAQPVVTKPMVEESFEMELEPPRAAA